MRFLLQVLCAGMLASSALAASNESLKAMETSVDSMAVSREDNEGDRNSGIGFNPLNQSAYTITNPYAANADKPFTIGAQPAAPAPEATRVTCGGRIWTDGEYLGSTNDGKKAYTKIHENRIYLNWGGTIPDNIYILFYLVEGTFPNNPQNDALIWNCVNPIDPSVQPQRLLGSTSDGKITCNGRVMENGEWLGTFVDNGFQTFQYTKYVDGLLRVMIKQGINDDRTTNYNTTLMKETIWEQHGSTLNPALKGFMTLETFNGCYWPTAPKPATPLADNNCQSGPALQSTSNVSQTGLRFAFTGSNIATVKWRIKAGGNTMREGTTGQLNGGTTVDIGFTSLAYGNYTLEIEGGSCTSAVSSRAFSIDAPQTPACQSGPFLQSTANVRQTGLNFVYTGSGISTLRWRIKSNGNVVRENVTGQLNGSTSVDISFASLAYGNYSLEIEGGNCVSAVSTRTFSISAPQTPDCQNGPVVNALRNLSPTSMTVDFGGSNLHIFSWRILQSGAVMANGRTNYIGGSTTDVGFSYLRNGEYTFEITAEDCKASGPATRTFSLSAPDTRPNCERGPNLESILTSNANSLEFRFDGANVFAIDWKIMQGTTMIRQSRVAPQNNHPVINYATLPTGVYTLEIDGGNCKSAVTAKKFGVDVALPIYIANFKGEVVEKGVELSWEVVAEQDGKEFEILRFDSDMKNEQSLGTVPLTDRRTGWYSFVDEKPLLGMSYYQLKQIDADGTFMKSKIVAINPAALTGKLVAPNPAREYVDVQFSSRTAGETEMKIYSVSGTMVGSSKIKITEGKNVHRVNVQKYNAGTYLMRIEHGGEKSVFRFLKVD